VTQSRLNHCLISYIYVYKEKLDKIDFHEIITRFVLQYDILIIHPSQHSFSSFFPHFVYSFFYSSYSFHSYLFIYIYICAHFCFSLYDVSSCFSNTNKMFDCVFDPKIDSHSLYHRMRKNKLFFGLFD